MNSWRRRVLYGGVGLTERKWMRFVNGGSESGENTVGEKDGLSLRR